MISSVMINASTQSDPWALPPLPEYKLRLQSDLIPYIPDKWLTVLAPVVAYWALSLFFHWIDVNDYFPQYRLHTPAEVAKRNRVSRWEVVRDVVIQQVVQTVVGLILGMTEPDDFVGKEQYDIAVWARRIRGAERAIPKVLALLGVNAKQLAGNVGSNHPIAAGALLGGQYSSLQTSFTARDSSTRSPGFAPWEFALASIIYWYLVPVVQFAIGIIVVDTWQYFLHRAMHMNKWLYSTSFTLFSGALNAADTNTTQQHFILAITASTSPMPTALSTTTPLKVSSSTPSVLPSPINSPECPLAKACAFSPARHSKP